MKDYIDHILEFPICIVAMGEDNIPKNFGTGFIYKYQDCYSIITARHVYLEAKKINLKLRVETSIQRDNKTVCIPMFELIYDNEDYDIAVFKLETQIDEYIPSVPLKYYCGPLQPPVKDEAYAFGSLKAVHFLQPTDEILILEREKLYEIGLELIDGIDSNFLLFKRPISSQYIDYKGCSGAPIYDPEGAIYSIVCGDKDGRNDIIRGSNISRILEGIHKGIIEHKNPKNR
jgi:hypothetical protein